MIKKITRHILLLVALAPFIFNDVQAQSEAKRLAPIFVVGAHLEGRLDGTPEAGYENLMLKVMPLDQSQAVFQRYPLVRALRYFEETERTCLFPASVSAAMALTEIEPADLIESVAIDRVSSHFMVRSDTNPPSNFDEMSGLTLAIQGGVKIEAMTGHETNFRIIRTPDDKTALRMLQASRVDAMYGWNPDALIISENNGLPLPHFNPDFILFDTTTHVVCKKASGVDAFLGRINERIEALRRSGQLREMLGPHARIVNE